MTRILMIAALVCATACQDEQRSRAEAGDDHRDGGDVADMLPDQGEPSPDAQVDATPDATPIPDATPPLDPAPCTFELEVVPVQISAVFFEPIVGGSFVYYGAPNEDGIVRTVRHVDGQPAGGPTDVLVDADGTHALLMRPGGDGSHYWVIRGPAGETRLGPSVGAGPGAIIEGLSAPDQWVAGESAMFRDVERRMWLWTGEAPALDLGASYVGRLSASAYAYADADGILTLVPRADGQTRQLGPANALWRMWLGGTRLWWSTDEGLFTTDVNGAPIHRIELGTCTDLVGDETTGFAVCNDEMGEINLYRVDVDGDDQPIVAVIDRAEFMHGLDLRDGWLAWSAWDTEGAWCDGDPNAEPGRVHWVPMPTGTDPDRPIVAEMGSGCLCCGAIWPDARLELGDDVLAFNYGAPGRSAAVGIVRRECP